MRFKFIACSSVDIQVGGHAIQKERQNNIITVLFYRDNDLGLLVWIVEINAWTFVDSDYVFMALYGTQQLMPEFCYMGILVYNQVVSYSCKRWGVSQGTTDSTIFLDT